MRWLGCRGECVREILKHAMSHHVVLCFVILRSVCVSEREIIGVCVCVCVCVCFGANVGVRYVPSVMPQSETSLVANNSKTRK